MPTDQSTSLGQGQNTAIRPYTLPDGFIYKGINVTSVRDKLPLRPAYIHREITVLDGNTVVDETTYQRILDKGKRQGQCPYAIDDITYWIVCISGFLFQVDFSNYTARVLNPKDRCNQYSNIINVRNMGKYLMVFDYPNRPLIVDRTRLFRTNTIPYGAPVSTDGVFNQNRGAISNGENEWLVSDPVGGASPNAPLSYLEATNPASEYFGAFDLGFANRNTRITYMGYLNTNGSGIGATLISNGSQWFRYATDGPRATWNTKLFGGPIISNVGTPGPDTAVNYKTDLYFLSSQGYVSSLKIARGVEDALTLRTISARFQNWLDTPFKELLQYSSMKVFGERILITAKPYRTTALDTYNNTIEDFAHAGITPMEFMVKQGSEDEFPVSPGLWTGVYPMAMESIGTKFYILSKDPGAINRFYELDPSSAYDSFKGKDKQIVARIYTKGYAFENIGVDKHLNNIELEASYSGEVSMDFHIQKSEGSDPIPLVCKYEDSVPMCEPGKSNGTERYLEDLKPGVEFSKANDCKKFFRSMMLVITYTARTFSLYRITLGADKKLNAERRTTLKNKGVIEKDCSYVHDLMIYSVADQNEFIK